MVDRRKPEGPRGRPPKRVKITKQRMGELCTHCPFAQCYGTGDARCPVNIESRAAWRADYRRKHPTIQRRRRGYWPEIHGRV